MMNHEIDQKDRSDDCFENCMNLVLRMIQGILRIMNLQVHQYVLLVLYEHHYNSF